MRKIILAFVLCTWSLSPLFSQEAFYIYRNDGDFNGFFFDEVKEMRYSKFALDNTECEQYVTYEVELADTTYRIPLAAIDSIGFQQPEIRFNPKVKFMQKDGYCPYFDQITGQMTTTLQVYFRDLPENMIPQVGDIFIGLPTDPIAKEQYKYGMAEGSFSCKVENVRSYDNEDANGPFKAYVIKGSPVEKLGDVYDQYITVEEIGVDKQGKVHRRIAGCTPDGFPRNAPAASGEGEISLIDFTNTFTRTWNPNETTNVDLAAEINLKVKLRAAYNITWSRFMTTISQDFITKVKPSFGLSYSRDFEFDSGELLPIDEIVFPAACPVFAIHPMPSLFFRGEGKAEAKLNMPAVQMGLGMHYIIDTDALFPISCGLHLAEDKEGAEISEEMLDLSGELTLNGFVQAGIKFSGDISTATWMKRIIKSSIGTYLYVGPKVGGQITLGQADAEGIGSLYNNMVSSFFHVALPSLDLEAKATVSVFSKEEKEKKFFDKNWSFFADTVRLAPAFNTPVIELDEENMHVTIPSKKYAVLGYQRVAARVRNNVDLSNPYTAYETSDIVYDRKKEAFEYTIPLSEFRSTLYEVYPIVKTWFPDPLQANIKEEVFIPPTLKVSNDSLVFGALTNLQQSFDITTNAVDTNRFWVNSKTGWTTRKEVVNPTAGQYRIILTLSRNQGLFDRHISKESGECKVGAYCQIARGELLKTEIPLGIYQKANDLPGFTFELIVRSTDCPDLWFGYTRDYPVTAKRAGDNKIHVEGNYVDGDYEYTVNVDLIRRGLTDEYSVSGTVTEKYIHESTYFDNERDKYVNCKETKISTATVAPTENSRGIVSQASYDYVSVDTDTGETLRTEHCEDANFNLWVCEARVNLQ